MRPLCGDAAAAVILEGQLYGPTRVLSVRRINAAAPVWRVGGPMVTARPRKKRAKRRKKKLVFLLLHLPLVLLDTTTQARTKHIDFCLRQETVAPVSVVCEICLCHRC